MVLVESMASSGPTSLRIYVDEEDIEKEIKKRKGNKKVVKKKSKRRKRR